MCYIFDMFWDMLIGFWIQHSTENPIVPNNIKVRKTTANNSNNANWDQTKLALAVTEKLTVSMPETMKYTPG